MQRIEFGSFYNALLEIKELSSKSVEEDNLTECDKFLYQNARYWGMKAVNVYINDTQLEEYISEGQDGWENSARRDKSIIDDVALNKGCSLIGYVNGAIIHNEWHHELCDQAVKLYDKDSAVVKLIFDSLKEKVIEELLVDYEFDIDLCQDSYNQYGDTIDKVMEMKDGYYIKIDSVDIDWGDDCDISEDEKETLIQEICSIAIKVQNDDDAELHNSITNVIEDRTGCCYKEVDYSILLYQGERWFKQKWNNIQFNPSGVYDIRE